MDGFEESLAKIRREALIGYQGQKPRPISETMRHPGASVGQQSPLLLCRLGEDGYVQVRQLFEGDHGAIAVSMSCFRPRVDGRAGDKGVIRNGRKHFAVEDTVLVDGVVFHLGVLQSGSFHVDKAGVLDMRTDASLPHLASRQRRPEMKSSSWPKRFSIGLGTGLAIACVDNLASGGEVSPIVIVALLTMAAAAFGGMWGRGAWTPALATWMCVPLAHLVKHVLELPDTLHPNTYRSITLLAGFTFVVTTTATGAGMLVHRRPRSRGPA